MAGPRNEAKAITASARSASARTLGLATASSPDKSTRPMLSGYSSSASATAAQASATPRPFGVAGRQKAPQPSLAANPSRPASAASSTPPPPPGPDQMSTA